MDKVPCELCDTPTSMTGTKRCDRCWELESRIRANREIAQLVMNRLADEDPPMTTEEFEQAMDIVRDWSSKEWLRAMNPGWVRDMLAVIEEADKEIE